MGRNAFLFILIFILLDIIVGEFLFYRYVFLVKNEEPKIVYVVTKFQENLYQSVLKELQVRESIFKDDSEVNYPNPFQ